jgi:cytoskeleton protein RodZ
MSTMDGAGTTETNRTAGGGLAEIGVMLRRRREELGQDLATIAATTHIRQHYLKAIEDGHRKELPGTAYMIGYVRTYADYLGFDGNRLITDYHAELAGQRKWVDKRAEPPAPTGVAAALPQVQLTPAMLLAVLLVLGVGIYLAWGYFSSKGEGTTETAAVDTPAPDPAATPEPAVEPTTKPPAGSPTGAEASAPPAAEPATTPENREPAAEDQVPPEAEVASTGDDTVEEQPAQEAAPADAKTVGKVVVRARLESWVQVTNAKKEVVFSRVLRVGETYTVPDEKGLTLTTGNAGGVDILLDGKKLKSLGAVGLVKRDIPLDPKKLKDGSAFKTSTGSN